MEKMVLNDLDVMYLKGLRLLAGLTEKQAASKLHIPAAAYQEYEQSGTEADPETWLHLVTSLHSLCGRSNPVPGKADASQNSTPEFARRYGYSAWLAVSKGLDQLEKMIQKDLKELKALGGEDTALPELEFSESLEWLPRQFSQAYDSEMLNLLVETIQEVRDRINGDDLYRLTTAAQEMIFHQAARMGVELIQSPDSRKSGIVLSPDQKAYLESSSWVDDYLLESMVGPYLFGNLRIDSDNEYYFYYWFMHKYNVSPSGLIDRIRKVPKNGKSMEEKFIEESDPDDWVF